MFQLFTEKKFDFSYEININKAVKTGKLNIIRRKQPLYNFTQYKS